jgi:hypothetical protein
VRRALAVAAAAVSIVTTAGCGGGGASSSAVAAAEAAHSEVEVEAEAAKVCQEAVLDVLKSPASAEFAKAPSVTPAAIAGEWTVIGDVDAQNGFGALLRRGYLCTATGAPGAMTGKDALLIGDQ